MSRTPPRPDRSSGERTRGIRFESTETGLAVVDEVERRREHLGTRPAAAPTPVSTDRLVAPVDRAVELSVSTIETDPNVVVVRDEAFDMIDHLAEGAEREYPPGRYVVDLSGSIKQYLQVDGRLSISTVDDTVVAVGDDADTLLGARSRHGRPTTEVTVPPTVDGLVRAVSTFGAALKTTTPDRSWPNLRDHPPAVSVGDDLDVPPGLQPQCPEVQVLVPPTERYVYAVAPLVYYLGAELVPHEGTPQLRTDAGFEYEFGRDDFERRVERTLKQVLFVESVIRAEGLTDLPLHERAVVDDHLPIDAAELFDQPAQVRLSTYLSLDYDAVAPHVPDWELEAHLAPRPDQVELLPYLVDDLAVVRTTAESDDTAYRSLTDATSEGGGQFSSFFRAGETNTDDRSLDDSVDLRGSATGTVEAVWGGDGVPVGASKVTRAAYENRLGRRPDRPPIDVAVVCNDDQMSEELDVTELYDGEKLPMNVSTYRNLSCAGLRTLVEHGDADFLHYIGHAEPDGLHCADETLSLETLEGTDIEAFLLNACQSFGQGQALIDAGAIGGLVTRRPVPIDAAAEVGKRVAELLNIGHPLRVAADVVQQTTDIGDRYQIVGDGSHAVAQRDSGVALAHELVPVDGDRATATEFDLRVRGYPSEIGIGGVFHPYEETFDYYLLGNETPWHRFRRDELVDFLTRGPEPVIVRSDDRDETTFGLSTVLAEELRSD